MSRLFETTEINGMELSNRFMRSATWEGMATEDGATTHQLIDHIERLAQGGVGLIISSHSYVRQDGQANLKQLGIYKDELIDGLKKLTDTVHNLDGKIVIQITHAGLFANPKFTGSVPLAPSSVEGFSESPQKEMTKGDIHEIIEAFVSSANRAKKAGFDGIQIFAGHGYLLSQFLSPFFNRRTDEYGGDVEGRAKLLLEILNKVRIVVGQDYPFLVKMNSEDFLEGGFTLAESLRVGDMLCKGGIDAIELSGGTWISGKNIPSRAKVISEDKEAYFWKAADSFKKEIDIPLSLVGGIRSFDLAQRLVAKGVTDYISMCRPFIREPDLINRWRAGNLFRATCISCNQCIAAGKAGKGIYCVEERKLKDKTP